MCCAPDRAALEVELAECHVEPPIGRDPHDLA
jgi:regulation of enolase protein 1 (concanavalin A-like superfamily)